MTMTPDQREAKKKMEEEECRERAMYYRRVEAERDNATAILEAEGTPNDLELGWPAKFQKARKLVGPDAFGRGFKVLCHARGITHTLETPKREGQTTIWEQGI